MFIILKLNFIVQVISVRFLIIIPVLITYQIKSLYTLNNQTFIYNFLSRFLVKPLSFINLNKMFRRNDNRATVEKIIPIVIMIATVTYFLLPLGTQRYLIEQIMMMNVYTRVLWRRLWLAWGPIYMDTLHFIMKGWIFLRQPSEVVLSLYWGQSDMLLTKMYSGTRLHLFVI